MELWNYSQNYFSHSINNTNLLCKLTNPFSDFPFDRTDLFLCELLCSVLAKVEFISIFGVALVLILRPRTYK